MTNQTSSGDFITVNPSPGTPEADLVIAVAGACLSASVTDVLIGFPQGGGQLRVYLGGQFSPSTASAGCAGGPYLPTAFWSQPSVTPAATPRLSTIQASIDAPRTAHVGDHVRYLVRLSNPTSTTVTLNPCPTYTEGLKGIAGGVHTYVLNCATVPSIRAGETVTFEMFIDVPASPVPAGGGSPSVLTWGCDIDGAGPYANAPIEIRP